MHIFNNKDLCGIKANKVFSCDDVNGVFDLANFCGQLGFGARCWRLLSLALNQMNCFPTRAQLNCIRGKQAEKSDESVENPPNNVFPSEIMSFSPDVLRFKFMPTSLNEDAVISVVSTCT